jgi:hypothetical protein
MESARAFMESTWCSQSRATTRGLALSSSCSSPPPLLPLLTPLLRREGHVHVGQDPLHRRIEVIVERQPEQEGILRLHPDEAAGVVSGRRRLTSWMTVSGRDGSRPTSASVSA